MKGREMQNSIGLVSVEKSFGELSVLRGLSYTFQPGVSYALVGASGSGKSTILHVLAGFERVTRGKVLWGSHELEGLSRQAREAFIRKMFGFVFQFHYLINELTVVENTMLSAVIAGQSFDENKKRALALLEAVGLADKADVLPPYLSGGQQQRAAIARALFSRPQFLLADEPTGNLDHATAQFVIDVCLKQQKEAGMGMLVATHDPAIFNRFEVILEVRDGLLVERKKT